MGGTGCCDGGGYPPGGGAPLLGPLAGRGGTGPAADVGGVAFGGWAPPPAVPTAGDIEREDDEPVGDGDGLKCEEVSSSAVEFACKKKGKKHKIRTRTLCSILQAQQQYETYNKT